MQVTLSFSESGTKSFKVAFKQEFVEFSIISTSVSWVERFRGRRLAIGNKATKIDSEIEQELDQFAQSEFAFSCRHAAFLTARRLTEERLKALNT